MKQTRFIPIGVCGLRVREAGEGEQSRTIEGTPIVFGVRSVNLTPWSDTRAVYEVLEKGCISPELLKRSDVILNLNLILNLILIPILIPIPILLLNENNGILTLCILSNQDILALN